MTEMQPEYHASEYEPVNGGEQLLYGRIELRLLVL